MKPSFNTTIIVKYIQLILIILTVIAVMLPEFNQIPSRDQGVYLYIGEQILDGKIPYRDVWDHKGPLIYYINVLGLLIEDSVIGIWILEIIFLTCTAFFSFAALKKLFPTSIAFPIVLIWLAAFQAVLDNGNTVEEYSLLFQFAAIYLFLRSIAEPYHNGWSDFFIGVTGGLAFALRPTNIGIHIALVIALVLCNLIYKRPYQKIFRQIAIIAAGGIITIVLIGFYFWVNNAFSELWQAVYVYNYYYSLEVVPNWGQSLLKGYEFLNNIIWLSLLGLFGMLLIMWKNHENNPIEFQFAIFLIFALPIQIYLSLISGRRYLHYYIAWLPVLTFLSAYFFSTPRQILEKRIQNYRFSNFIQYGFIIFITFFMVYPVITNGYTFLPAPSTNINPPRDEITKYIRNNTTPEEYVFIWGNEVTYNFLTGRESPSRFTYIYPFGAKDYVTQSMVDELINEIKNKHPIIIDATHPERYTAKINSERWAHIPTVQELVIFIEQNYSIVEYIGPHQWPVLRPKNND